MIWSGEWSTGVRIWPRATEYSGDAGLRMEAGMSGIQLRRKDITLVTATLLL